MSDLHVVLGASGGLGNAVVRELVRQGKRVRAANRSGHIEAPDSGCLIPDYPERVETESRKFILSKKNKTISRKDAKAQRLRREKQEFDSSQAIEDTVVHYRGH